MKSAWIPSEEMYARDQEGVLQKIVFIDNRGLYPNGKVGLDLYYDANHAVFSLFDEEELEYLPGYKQGTEANGAAELYNKTFQQ